MITSTAYLRFLIVLAWLPSRFHSADSTERKEMHIKWGTEYTIANTAYKFLYTAFRACLLALKRFYFTRCTALGGIRFGSHSSKKDSSLARCVLVQRCRYRYDGGC